MVRSDRLRAREPEGTNTFMRVTNIIATGEIGQRIDLEKANIFDSVRYDPTFTIVSMFTASMHSMVSVFSSGKMISVGTTTEEQARHDLAEVAKYLADKKLVDFVDPG